MVQKFILKEIEIERKSHLLNGKEIDIGKEFPTMNTVEMEIKKVKEKKAQKKVEINILKKMQESAVKIQKESMGVIMLNSKKGKRDRRRRRKDNKRKWKAKNVQTPDYGNINDLFMIISSNQNFNIAFLILVIVFLSRLCQILVENGQLFLISFRTYTHNVSSRCWY